MPSTRNWKDGIVIRGCAISKTRIGDGKRFDKLRDCLGRSRWFSHARAVAQIVFSLF